MAMITCENCGAEISDKALNCPKCGVKIKKKSAVSKIGKKTWIVIGCILGIIIAGFLGIIIFQTINEAKMDSTDEYVLRCVEILMQEEGNISLENNILYSVKGEGDIYVIIEFRSSSGRDVAYFKNQKYLGTDTDYARIKNRDYDDVKAGRITQSEYKEILEKQLAFALAKGELAYWNLMAQMGSSGSENMHLVSAKKIGKKLGISYPK